MKQVREVRVKDLVRYFWLPLAALAVIWAAFGAVTAQRLLPCPVWATLVGAIVLSYLPLRLLAMGCVFMYKAYAPLSVRAQCRFEPTCSTYMLLSIKKYGLIAGIYKGLRRICRCKPPNGGQDWP